MKRAATVLYILTLVGVAVLLLLIGVNENKEEYQARNDLGLVTVDEYQCQDVADADTPLGIRKVYTWTLPESIEGDTSLAFYYVHQYVKVYLDDELMYFASPADEKRIGKTLGCDWAVVPLLAEDAGKQVQVDVIPVYQTSVNRTITFYEGSKFGIARMQAKKDGWQIGLSMVSILIGLVFLGIACYHILTKKQKSNLWVLGAFSVMLGIWRLTDTWFSPILFPANATLLFYLSVTMLMVGVVPLVKMLQTFLYENDYMLLDIFCILSSAVCILVLAAQMLGIADIRENLIIIHVLILLGILLTISIAVYDRIKYKKSKNGKILWICVAGIAMDVVAYYIKGNSVDLFFSLLAFQIYVWWTGTGIIKSYIEWEKKLSEQEAELMGGRVSIMLSQIQPHFLYNSLTSIAYLCGKDPDGAKRAINDFADYLRGNMDSLKQKTPVPFEMELKHIKIYLSLEKMRFEEELQITYDIQTMDFRIPSLTIQPLVENAVKHGVGKAPSGGTVVIGTREKEDCYEVIVADNGVGFDVNQQAEDGKNHIGIANVRSRLWEMSRATLDISSEPGKGTTATIMIPKNQ